MMIRHNKVLLFLISIVLSVALATATACRRQPKEDFVKTTFSGLLRIRQEKKREVIEYFNDIESLAFGIKDDAVMKGYFNQIKNNGYRAARELESRIDNYYIERYANFYDILFIDSTGYVFHSIKKESDYRRNIFDDELAATRLERAINEHNTAAFADYEYYRPSEEPAAFFCIPITDDSGDTGSFVLQCPINTINAILTGGEELGRTGEVYLVNQDKLMLSDSRFIGDSTILKLRVDTRAVREALRNTSGEEIIEDYRGVRVFSSFEKFNVFGTWWIIIAEIDEDEVITEHYKRHRKYFQKRIFRYLADVPRVNKPKTAITGSKRVDVNEFGKALPGTALETYGISTCTGIAVLLPYEFGYLAHISPADEIYISSVIQRLFLGSNATNFLDELVRRILYYNLLPCEVRKLQFFLAAPDNRSFGKAVDSILGYGVELSSITLFHNPRAQSANMLLDLRNNVVEVYWSEEGTVSMEKSGDTENMGQLVKRLIDYED